ncbi:hypothetical protein CSUB01_04307 [Colletotrichum sublineola]|uniref:Uncharacterized protein n=1 Tax=Colletotrichum sublineola TaxID=1173701 RepID=A0A066XAM8_COLSU|nr:hypothetical protein CSUB01_04307 [Colletotrichum sublineola]
MSDCAPSALKELCAGMIANHTPTYPTDANQLLLWRHPGGHPEVDGRLVDAAVVQRDVDRVQRDAGGESHGDEGVAEDESRLHVKEPEVDPREDEAEGDGDERPLDGLYGV